MEPILSVSHLEKVYGSRGNRTTALSDLSFDVLPGEFVGIIGHTGSGKSTLIQVISGLLDGAEGQVLINGVDYMAKKADRKQLRRTLGVVFQYPEYQLFEETVYRDIAFGPTNMGLSKDEIDRRVREAAEILDINQFLDRKPKALSGGQRQRVAIGRAIVRDPQVFLMDEPLSNLDAKLRNQMRAEIIKLRQRINTTFIYVTHDQTEAMTLGDRIVIMKDGFIQQIGTPQEVFDQPANLFVAGFIGSPQMNFFDGELEKKDGKYQLKVGEATVVLGGKAQELLAGKGVGERKVTVGIRPEHIAFAAAPGSDTVSSKVDVSEMMGSEVYLHVNAVGRDVVLRIPTTDLPAEHRAGIPYGTEINFAFRPDLIHLFDPETEKNLMY